MLTSHFVTQSSVVEVVVEEQIIDSVFKIYAIVKYLTLYVIAWSMWEIKTCHLWHHRIDVLISRHAMKFARVKITVRCFILLKVRQQEKGYTLVRTLTKTITEEGVGFPDSQCGSGPFIDIM